MDLLLSEAIYDTVLDMDLQATAKLTDYVEQSLFRNPQFADYFVDGYGGVGGKLTLRIKYRLLQQNEIERTITVSFATDIGEEIPALSTVVVEKVETVS